jgi:hypothetical protein
MSALSKLLFRLALGKLGARRLHNLAARERRRELAGQLRPVLGRAVLAGPFQGMELPDAASWGDGDFLPKLLGTYEANLHQAVIAAVARRPDPVINVGCAEGYYAVGLARLLPGAAIHAFDIDAAALQVCAAAAAANGVGARVRLEGLCTAARIAELCAGHRRALLVLDCEGAERELLDPAALASCDVLVETHDFIHAGLADELEARFRATHRVERIAQGGRDPNAAALAKLAESDRWLLVDEGRPESMVWLACWALS